VTTYLIVQAINITILIVLGVVLSARTRADVGRRLRALQEDAGPGADASEQRKLELRTRIETLQRELNELDRAQVSALRPPPAGG
jgi:hypothetical protein